MTRPIDARLIAAGRLVAESPVHVGGMPDDLETDMPLARDGRGRFYVPGTSLAGALRAWMWECFPDHESLLYTVWGYQPEPRVHASKARRGGEAETADTGSASRILIDDGTATLPPGLDEEVWDGVGIDRESGSAARGIKFDRAVLPVGTEIGLRILMELPGESRDAARARAMLGHLLAALQDGKIGLGASGTRGLGRVRLHLDELTCEDWSSRSGVLAILRAEGGKALTLTELQGAAEDFRPRPPQRLQFRIHWHPDGPLMTRAGHDGVAVDMLPMVSATGDGQLAMVLPGSGTKGALRNQAERIVRTVRALGLDEAADNGRARHRKQLQVRLVEHLFGAAKRAADGSGGERSEQELAGRGALSVSTTYAEGARAAPEHWQAIAEAEPDPEQGVSDPAKSWLFRALEGAGLGGSRAAGQSAPHLERASHVAVDRWTGGAADGMLFSAIEPFAIPWAPIELTLEPARLPVAMRKPALALLLLVLRDLAEGRLTLGFGANRGYGSLVVERLELSVVGGADDADSLAWLDGKILDLPLDPAALDVASMTEVEQAWQTWIDSGGEHD